MDPRSKIFRTAPRSIRTRSVVLMKKAAELHHLGAQVTLTIRVDGEIITLNPHYTKDVPCSAEQLNREGNATGRRARLLDEPAHTVELTALAACVPIDT
ncbi:hypothetical protein BN1723_012524 [Verticillium longisporum]|uniref:Uncharacterized protein n=1 Tax=Verticillium longisporum TaxID=100787 RepID=A0A0G4LIP2_VERLO|nr:hypothetical protein BN1723_012524 [Verticillium longisporum]